MSLWAAIFLELRRLVHPAERWRHFDSAATGAIAFSAILGTLPLALLFTNFVLGIIPPLRKANELAASGVPGMSLREATQGLLKPSLVIVSLCVLAALIGSLKA